VMRGSATAATDLACHVFGRKQVVRVARFTLRRARLDIRNDRCANGEESLIRWLLRQSSPGQTFHAVDVGANIGQWAMLLLNGARMYKREADLDLHSFEPSSYTFARLSEILHGQRVTLNQMAVGDRSGTATLHVELPGAATNSLHVSHLTGRQLATEDVQVVTLDDYADQAELKQIDLLKIDAEGHDMAVIRGATQLFGNRSITVAQFEYNHRWIYGRFFLRDVFSLLDPMGYRIGKLTPFGVEFYPGWDPDLETFVEGNYLACAPSVARHLPSVRWWKDRG